MTDKTNIVPACPECDNGHLYHRKEGRGSPLQDADAEYRCNECGATFDDPVQRDTHTTAGRKAKYQDLDLDDVGLSSGVDD